MGSNPISQNRVHRWLSEPDSLIRPRRARIFQTNPAGTANTWVCGAWLGHGFHEDGLFSAVNVAHEIRWRDAAVGIAAQ
jgi:predicted NAD/FAD-binding protein